MKKPTLRCAALLVLALATPSLWATDSQTSPSSQPSQSSHPSHPSIKRGFSLPPAADLLYSIKARQRGITINGDATVQWRHGDGNYSLHAVSHAGLFGKILENHSEGAIDDYGLAPATFQEKRFRKEATSVTFHRDSKTITFSKGEQSYPIKGGEQDRVSAPWQLAAQARSAPDKFTAGSQWAYFVTGRRDAESWVFRTVGRETLQTGAGAVDAVHFVKSPPKGDANQQVDLWLAPGLDWYPVRILFVDDDGDYVDQLLEKVTRK